MKCRVFPYPVAALVATIVFAGCLSQNGLDSSTETVVSVETSPLLEGASQEQPPVIDMHIHAFGKNVPYGIRDYLGNMASADPEMLFAEVYERFREYNVVKAMVSGSPEAVEAWKSKDEDDRIIRGITMFGPNDNGMNAERFERLVKDGKIQVFGELAPIFSGMTLSDPEWQPYLKICEQYDVPVAVHTGGGPPGFAYTWAPKTRLRLGDPYLIEDVLIRYPKLRIYMMHSGEGWPERVLRMMVAYPQLYSDLGALLWVGPNAQRFAREFLRNAKHDGCLERVMFGSDNISCPQVIDISLAYLDSIEFLSEQDRRDILYSNAVRFLGLQE